MTTATLPTDVKVGELISVLVARLNMPKTGADGQIISYKLNHQNKTRQLLSGETLAQAGVPDGSILRLLREIMAG